MNQRYKAKSTGSIDDFDQLEAFRRVLDPATLGAAWDRVRGNGGCAGGDGETIDQFGLDVDRRLVRLGRALARGRYHPGPLRELAVPKPRGGTRLLRIPSVVDRVAQTAVNLVLLPLLDPLMDDASYGYRPGRSVAQAVRRVAALRAEGFSWVVDADIDDFFDSVPHDRLVARLEELLGDGPLVDLTARWLEAASEHGRGLPQGAPVSPLLSNVYLDALDQSLDGAPVRLVRFADDFVLLCRDEGKAAYWLERVRSFLAAKGLALDAEKTRIVSFDRGFRFLGHLFVRSVVLPSDEEGPPDAELVGELRAVAAGDLARDAAELAVADERRAGFDRVLRVLYVMEPGRRLTLRNQSFSVVEQPSVLGGGTGAEVIAIPADRVDRIEVGPRVDADFEALRHAALNDTCVSIVDGHGRELGLLDRGRRRHAGLHLAQARLVENERARLETARVLVGGRIRNQRALLRRLNRRRKLETVVEAVMELNRRLRTLERAETVAGLRGVEGAATAVYWPALGGLVQHGFAFIHRRREPPPDPANLALNFAASLLLRDLECLIVRRGLHPGFGVLHGSRDGHDGLVYDLVEEFRAPLVEGLVVYLFNNRMLDPTMFAETAQGWRIDRFGGDAMIKGYEAWLDRPVQSPRSGRRVLWRRLVEEQVVAFAAHVRGEAAYRPYKMDY